jgi:hypothetical protein
MRRVLSAAKSVYLLHDGLLLLRPGVYRFAQRKQ